MFFTRTLARSHPHRRFQRHYAKDSSIKTHSRKIDPEFQKAKLSKIDIEGIRYFKRIEDRYKHAMKGEDLSKLKQDAKGFFPSYHQDLVGLEATDIPDIQNDPVYEGEELGKDYELPYDTFNFKNEEHFGMAMGYLSKMHFSNFDEKGEISQSEFGEYDEDDDIDDSEQDAPKKPTSNKIKYVVKKVLQVGRHTQVTAAGKVFSFSSLVMLGTGKGTAGIGYGRAQTVQDAVELAKSDAERNLISVELWRGNHIGTEIRSKFKRSYCWIIPRKPGYGSRVFSSRLDLVLECFGITDCSMGTAGADNKAAMYRAMFLGLRDGVRSPEETARILGRKLFNRQKGYYYRND